MFFPVALKVLISFYSSIRHCLNSLLMTLIGELLWLDSREWEKYKMHVWQGLGDCPPPNFYLPFSSLLSHWLSKGGREPSDWLPWVPLSQAYLNLSPGFSKAIYCPVGWSTLPPYIWRLGAVLFMMLWVWPFACFRCQKGFFPHWAKLTCSPLGFSTFLPASQPPSLPAAQLG